MSQSKMFKEFNDQYEIGKIESTHDNLTKFAGLVLDEVIEMYEELFDDVEITINHGKAKDVDIEAFAFEATDVRYITGERMTAHGLGVDAFDKEKHRSNMSKLIPIEMSAKDIGIELATARLRYPSVELHPVKGGFLLKCADTGKVVKPLCYSKAVGGCIA